MVQHDNRVQMRGRQSAGSGVSGRRRTRDAEVIYYQDGTGGEWYEEEGSAVGQGRNPYRKNHSGQRRHVANYSDAGNKWGDVYEKENMARPGARRRQVEVPVIASGSAPARPTMGGTGRGPGQGRPRSASSDRRASVSRNASRSAARARRRKRVLMQRMVVCLWAVCIFLAAAIFLLRNDKPSAAANGQSVQNSTGMQEDKGETRPNASSALVQGLPAEEFAKHPEWEEKFLTPNEYSRPGDPLESVKNIFVHYTANPGTSAAQNRSYFEQQKDVHQSSVSAHFIIGYEGEIIQCVPLDEVAYAVQTRNYDSVSIECCHLAKDGSFTQETYDSLISLLAWLTDVYDLGTEDILRHYDCGGKKCPLYYTENPDAWEQLKKDVDKL